MQAHYLFTLHPGILDAVDAILSSLVLVSSLFGLSMVAFEARWQLLDASLSSSLREEYLSIYSATSTFHLLKGMEHMLQDVNEWRIT
jgi:hypothetical protein